jgi:hypothetical protein
MHHFSSTAVQAAEYDSQTLTLTLWLNGGDHGYYYYNVPQHIFDGLLKASSKGRYFNAYIRDQYAA